MIKLLNRAAEIFWWLYCRLVVIAFTVAYVLTLLFGGEWSIEIYWHTATNLCNQLFN